ncbi:hypothetical protein G6F56_003915 [Rhizopus delemar]|nr:hypothetical protein G6F56_003915 [Rhizopus delemar]
MQHDERPRLPSIQSMLGGASLKTTTKKELIRYAPEHMSAFQRVPPHFEELEKPSIEHTPLEPKMNDPTFRTHTRSYSDYTHPYHHMVDSTPVIHHRRALSTNTADLLLHPLAVYPNNTDSNVNINPPDDNPIPQDNNKDYQEEEDKNSSSEESVCSEIPKRRRSQRLIKVQKQNKPRVRKKRSPPTKKHPCTYCSKTFSRPSSLRIHTYSHTGERPYECPEPCCFRKFSVQSNMKRHLRVHDMGRPVRRNGNVFAPISKIQMSFRPLAIKKDP